MIPAEVFTEFDAALKAFRVTSRGYGRFLRTEAALKRACERERSAARVAELERLLIGARAKLPEAA